MKLKRKLDQQLSQIKFPLRKSRSKPLMGELKEITKSKYHLRILGRNLERNYECKEEFLLLSLTPDSCSTVQYRVQIRYECLIHVP